MRWIQGYELLEPPYNKPPYSYTKDKILNDVVEGTLVPYYSPDRDWFRRHDNPAFVAGVVERMFRVFPTKELEEKWKSIPGKRDALQRSSDLSQQTDEELILEHKQLLNDYQALEHEARLKGYQHDVGLLVSQPDLETFINSTLPEWRERQKQNLENLPTEIKELEEETAPDRVWRNLNLNTPAKQEIFLNSYYSEEQVESLANPETKPQRGGERITASDEKEIKQLIEQALPEIETIYSAIKEVGLSAPSEELQAAALDEYDVDVDKAFYKFIDRDYLENKELYIFNPTQGPRDFMGRLLKMIVKFHLGIDNIGAQSLWKMTKR
jgi:hypothetical protein